LVLPATGPKWLVSSGFDRALIRMGWLAERRQRALLLGASAGAWRALALACPDPDAAHRALVDAYCEQRFTQADDARSISAAYRKLLTRVLPQDALPQLLAHPGLDLAITSVRSRAAAHAKLSQGLSFAAAAALNPLHPRAIELLFERTLFHTRFGADAHPLLQTLRGRRQPLTAENLHGVALASGSVPFYMQPVTGLTPSAEHAYLDGGVTDYHLRQELSVPEGVVVLFLHQARILPNWFDKFVPWRGLPESATQDLLLIYPDDEFIRALPGSAIPTRDDFKTSQHDPGARIERWRKVAAVSSALGDAFEQDVRSGQLSAQLTAL
jgi:hypothetical protein